MVRSGAVDVMAGDFRGVNAPCSASFETEASPKAPECKVWVHGLEKHVFHHADMLKTDYLGREYYKVKVITGD